MLSLARISELLEAQLSVPEFMRSLIDLHATKYPRHDWRSLRALDWSEHDQLAHWLARVLDEEPPGRQRVLWLGIFNPIRDGQPNANLYIAGSNTWDVDGDWWGADKKTWWWPDLRHAHSRCLDELYQRCYPTGPGNDAENLLGLGYAARVFVELVRTAARDRFLGGNAQVALAVGWDSGGPFGLGMLTRSGLQLRSAAETGAAEARSAAAAARRVAELEARLDEAARGSALERSAASRHFSHPDGRRWSIAAVDGGAHLEFTDQDGDVFRRELRGEEGTREAAVRLIADQLADGFFETPKPADGVQLSLWK